MILNYLKCQRPRLFISAAYSDASDRTRRTRCKRENNLWYPGQSRLDFCRFSSSVFDASQKELFRKDEWGFILKTTAANRACNRQKGQVRVYIQSEREKASVLFTSTVSFTLKTKSVSCARQICSYCESLYFGDIGTSSQCSHSCGIWSVNQSSPWRSVARIRLS